MRTLLLLLSLLPLFAPLAAGQDVPDEVLDALGEDLAAIVQRADAVAVYSVAPEPAGDGSHIGGFPILTERKLGADADRRRLLDALLDGATYGGSPAKCFIPHHAIRLRTPEVAASLVVCFECSQMVWVEEKKTIVIRETSPLRDALRVLLEEAGDPAPGDDPAGRAVAEGKASLTAGRFADAVASFARALELDPTRAEAYHGRAVALYQLGRAEESIADLSRAVEIDPRQAQVYVDRGTVRLAIGDMEGGLADLDRAIALEPDLTVAYLRRSVAHARLGRIEAALADCDMALRLDPTQAEVLIQRGSLREARGDGEGALADYRRALALAPADWSYRERVERKIAALEGDD